MMSNKTIIITGANSGLGKQTALELAQMGGKIIMACRNLQSAKVAREEIVAASDNNNIEILPLDLCSKKSIEVFAETVKERYQRIDVLIQNAGFGAGLMKLPKAKEFDNMDVTLTTNFYGPFLLTYLLLDFLKNSDQVRIIFVTSAMYRFGFISRKPPERESNYGSPVYEYSRSKTALNMFGVELARRLEGTGITVNLVHPGTCKTDIFRNIPFPFSILFDIGKRFLFKTLRDGVEGIIYCSVAPNLAKTTGKYFVEAKETKLWSKVTQGDKNKEFVDACKEKLNINYENYDKYKSVEVFSPE